jgi:antitoxin HicB
MKTPTEYLREPYARVVIPSDGAYHAEILEFPGCFAQGGTPEEAYANLERAAATWIEACREQGQEIPAPHASLGYGGKIALRLPRSLHRQAARLAERDGVSMNQFLTSAIAWRLGAEDLASVLAERLAAGAREAGIRLAARAGTQPKLRAVPRGRSAVQPK